MARGPRYASRCEGARPQAPPLPQSARDATLMDTMAAFKFVFLPPQSDTVRQWAATLSGKVPQMEVSLPNRDDAGREIANADAAFGTLSADLLGRADKLRWLQAPAIAPPAGYYFPELVAHPVVAADVPASATIARNVQATVDPATQSVTITWTTEAATGTEVQFGTAPGNLEFGALLGRAIAISVIGIKGPGEDCPCSS